MTWQHLPAPAFKRMPWRNGLGWTTELLVQPAQATLENGFDWRCSIAEIDSDCDFSAFPGYDRLLMLLAGDGIELSGSGFEQQTLRERGRVAAFAGEAAPHCRVIGGPSRDFNLMLRRGAWRGQLMLRPLAGQMLLFAEPGVQWLVHVLQGRARLRKGALQCLLEHGAALHLAFGAEERERLLIDGAGELVLARVEPAGAAASV